MSSDEFGMSADQKQKLKEKIKSDIEDFLAAGGIVTELEYGVRREAGEGKFNISIAPGTPTNERSL